MEFVIDYYETKRGRRPIDKEMIQPLNQAGDKQTAKRLIVCMELLKKNGLRADDEVVHKLRDDIWSIRVCDYRILCFEEGDCIICTNAFLKKSNEVPDRQIERAKKLRKDWYARHAKGTEKVGE